MSLFLIIAGLLPSGPADSHETCALSFLSLWLGDVDPTSSELGTILRDVCSTDLSACNIMAWPPEKRPELRSIAHSAILQVRAAEADTVDVVALAGQAFLSDARRFAPTWYALWALSDCRRVPKGCWGLFAACVVHAAESLHSMVEATAEIERWSFADRQPEGDP